MTELISPLALAPGAFLAGLLMFIAPCTLPLVPAYLAFIAGVPEREAVEARSSLLRGKIFFNALAFVAGFSIVFILFGIFAAFLGAHLGEGRYLLARLGGVVLVFFGIAMLGIFRIPFLSSEWRPGVPAFLSLGHPGSALFLGALFALGWSPCIGPVLGSVLFLASASSTVLQGALLLFVFSLGLAVPFLLCALALGVASRAVIRLAAASVWLERIGAVFLICIGILMAFGGMNLLVSWGLSSFNYAPLLNYM